MSKYIIFIILNFFSIQLFSQNQKDNGSNFIFSLLVNKEYDISLSYFDKSLTESITVSSLQDITKQIENQIGKFKNVLEVNEIDNVYYFYSEFENQKLDIQLSFNKDNKIVGFFFVPHKEFKKENSLGKEFNIKSNNCKSSAKSGLI